MPHRALDVNLLYPTVKVEDQTLLRYSAKFVNKATRLRLTNLNVKGNSVALLRGC